MTLVLGFAEFEMYSSNSWPFEKEIDLGGEVPDVQDQFRAFRRPNFYFLTKHT